MIYLVPQKAVSRMANSQDKLQQGYQITHEVVQRAIANDFDCAIENVKVESIKKSEGAGKGEGYTCVLFALDIKGSFFLKVIFVLILSSKNHLLVRLVTLESLDFFVPLQGL